MEINNLTYKQIISIRELIKETKNTENPKYRQIYLFLGEWLK